jgi:hypothetical protein
MTSLIGTINQSCKAYVKFMNRFEEKMLVLSNKIF